MENCIDLVDMNQRHLVVIKQPGSVRDPKGRAIHKIEMTLQDAVDLHEQLSNMLMRAEIKGLFKWAE